MTVFHFLIKLVSIGLNALSRIIKWSFSFDFQSETIMCNVLAIDSEVCVASYRKQRSTAAFRSPPLFMKYSVKLIEAC